MKRVLNYKLGFLLLLFFSLNSIYGQIKYRVVIEISDASKNLTSGSSGYFKTSICKSGPCYIQYEKPSFNGQKVIYETVTEYIGYDTSKNLGEWVLEEKDFPLTIDFDSRYSDCYNIGSSSFCSERCNQTGSTFYTLDNFMKELENVSEGCLGHTKVYSTYLSSISTVGVCQNLVITNKGPQKYEYSLNGIDNWINIDSYVKGFNLDVVPTTLKNVGSGYNGNLYIRGKFISNSSEVFYSDILTLNVIPCSPQLTATTPKATTCSDSQDGSATFAFNRDLAAGEYFNFTLYKKDPNGDILVGDKRVDQAAFANQQFSWSGLPTGTYYLRYQTFQNNGSAIASAENSSDFIISSPPAVSFTTSQQNIACKGASTGSISLSAQGGNGSYQYSKDGGATWQNSAAFSALPAGSYSVLVRDSQGCVAVQGAKQLLIIEPLEAIRLDIVEKNNPIEHDGAQGNIQVLANGGVGSLSYLWQNSLGSVIGAGATIANLVGGDYTATVTDANLCTASKLITLINPPVFAVSITPTKTISCSGASNAQLKALVSGGTAPLYFRWEGAFSNDETLDNIPAGNYKVIVTDVNGVLRQASYTVVAPAPLQVVQTSTKAVSCKGGTNGSIDITVSGGTSPYTYQWTKSYQSIGTSQDLNTVGAGLYDCTVTDARACTSQLTAIEVSEPQENLTATTTLTPPRRFGGTDGGIELEVNGGTAPYAYLWNTGSTTQNLQNLGEGSYTVTLTDSKLCTATQSVTLTQPEKLEVQLNQNAAVLCHGAATASLEASATGGVQPYTYQWKKNSVLLTDNSDLLTNLAAAQYELIVKDRYNNTVTTSYTLAEPTALVLENRVQNLLCFEQNTGAIQLKTSGGTSPYTYQWFDATATPLSTTQDLTQLAAGTYYVVCTDANACVLQSDNSVIDQPKAAVVVSSVVTQPKGFGLSNGKIALATTGGTAPYTYLWNTGNISQDNSNIKAGNYTVTATDAHACQASLTVQVAEPTLLETKISLSKSLLCKGDTDGRLYTTTTGGVPPYTYVWKKGTTIVATTPEIQNLTADTYTVLITDNNNNQTTQTLVLGEPEQLSVGFAMTPISCSGGSEGSLTALPQGGVAPYFYSWSNGETNSSLTQMGAGNYLVNVTDANGCATLANGSIRSASNIKVSATVEQPSCYQSCTGAIALSLTGGSGNYDINWDNNPKITGLQATSLCAGTYNVIIKDKLNGCILPMSFSLNQAPELKVNLGEDKVLCKEQATKIQPTSNSDAIAYSWTSSNGFNANTPQVNLSKAGEYQLEITNTKGCKAKDTIQITTSDQMLEASFLVSSQMYNNQDIVLINVSNQTGQRYEWLLPAEATIVSDVSKSRIIKFSKIGNYTVGLQSKNEAGCSTITNKQIVVEEDPKLSSSATDTSTFIKEFVVYPNPTNNDGIFSVKVSLSEAAPISLTLYQQSNGILLNQTDLASAKTHLKEYNIRLSSGVYLIILRTSRGVQSKKIIVN